MAINNRDIEQLMSEITSKNKWYVVNGQKGSSLRVTAMRIRKGDCKIVTVVDFFRIFGYELHLDVSVRKVKS